MMLKDRIKETGKGIGRFLGEYFLGTETRRFYARERGFYMEHAPEEEVKSRVRELRAGEIVTIIIGKIIPNLASSLAASAYILTRNNSYLYAFGASEGVRAYYSLWWNIVTKSIMAGERLLIRTENLVEDVERISKKIPRFWRG